MPSIYQAHDWSPSDFYTGSDKVALAFANLPNQITQGIQLRKENELKEQESKNKTKLAESQSQYYTQGAKSEESQKALADAKLADFNDPISKANRQELSKLEIDQKKYEIAEHRARIDEVRGNIKLHGLNVAIRIAENQKLEADKNLEATILSVGPRIFGIEWDSKIQRLQTSQIGQDKWPLILVKDARNASNASKEDILELEKAIQFSNQSNFALNVALHNGTPSKTYDNPIDSLKPLINSIGKSNPKGANQIKTSSETPKTTEKGSGKFWENMGKTRDVLLGKNQSPEQRTLKDAMSDWGTIVGEFFSSSPSKNSIIKNTSQTSSSGLFPKVIELKNKRLQGIKLTPEEENYLKIYE